MLANDIARCNGQVDARGRTADPCIDCERRTAPRADRQPFMNGCMHPGNTYCQDRIPSMTVWPLRCPNHRALTHTSTKGYR